MALPQSLTRVVYPSLTQPLNGLVLRQATPLKLLGSLNSTEILGTLGSFLFVSNRTLILTLPEATAQTTTVPDLGRA